MLRRPRNDQNSSTTATGNGPKPRRSIGLGCLGVLLFLGVLSFWIEPEKDEVAENRQSAPMVEAPKVDPAQTHVLEVAKRVTVAMKACDASYRIYRAKPSKAAADESAQRCLDASGNLGNMTADNAADPAQKEALNSVLKKCVIAAGARYGWLFGVAYPEAKISDGEENAVSKNLACIDGFIETAGSAGIAPDDPRLDLPLYIGGK